MSLGRPLEFDPALALEAALDVFWQKGFEATSLRDLLDAMGLSKSSFYQAFGSKHELFERCLVRFRNRQVGAMSRQLERSASGRAFIREVLAAHVDEAACGRPSKGCLLMNTATEFAGRDPGVGALVTEGTAALREVLSEAIRRAQAAGDIAPEAEVSALANYLLTTIAGLKAMVKAGTPPDVVAQVVDVALKALD